MTTRQTWLLIFIVLVSAWLQASLSNRMTIYGGRPDIVLTTIVCIGVLLGSVNSALFGVWGGFLTAVMAGINYGSILVSRCLTVVLAGFLRQHVIQDSIIVPPLTIFLATWISEGLYFLMAPDLHAIRQLLRAVLAESLFDAVISVPIYFGLRAMGIKDELRSRYNPYFETT